MERNKNENKNNASEARKHYRRCALYNREQAVTFSGMQNNLAIRMRAKKILKNTNQLRKKLMEIKVMKK